MRLKFKLEPEPGQSDGFGSSEIPRLRAALAPAKYSVSGSETLIRIHITENITQRRDGEWWWSSWQRGESTRLVRRSSSWTPSHHSRSQASWMNIYHLFLFILRVEFRNKQIVDSIVLNLFRLTRIQIRRRLKTDIKIVCFSHFL